MGGASFGLFSFPGRCEIVSLAMSSEFSLIGKMRMSHNIQTTDEAMCLKLISSSLCSSAVKL